MEEEFQKRIHERQKEFFSEIEVHEEKLDDVFKAKRERWKGFNRYVKEFHKRKDVLVLRRLMIESSKRSFFLIFNRNSSAGLVFKSIYYLSSCCYLLVSSDALF